MAEIFNELIANYQSSIENPLVGFVYRYSCIQLIGDIKGKSILDFGCGDGVFSRLIKQFGASEVVGVDLSEKMIAACNKKEQLETLGIKYMIKDIRDMPKIDEFDIGVASFVLHFSETREQLFAMCTNIFKNLKYGGKLFCVVGNPNFKGITDYSEYYYQIIRSPVMKDGDIITLNVFHKSTNVSLKYYHYSKETYENILTTVGFKNIRWTNLSVSPDGIKKFGSEHWKAFLEDPYLIIITADK